MIDTVRGDIDQNHIVCISRAVGENRARICWPMRFKSDIPSLPALWQSQSIAHESTHTAIAPERLVRLAAPPVRRRLRVEQ